MQPDKGAGPGSADRRLQPGDLIRPPSQTQAPELTIANMLSSLVRAIDALTEVIRNEQATKSCTCQAVTKTDLEKLGKQIMATQQQTTDAVKALTAQVKAAAAEVIKIGTETSATLALCQTQAKQIADLQALIASGAAGDTTPALADAVAELQTTADDLTAQAKAADDLTPDAPATPPVDVPPTNGGGSVLTPTPATPTPTPPTAVS